MSRSWISMALERLPTFARSEIEGSHRYHRPSPQPVEILTTKASAKNGWGSDLDAKGSDLHAEGSNMRVLSRGKESTTAWARSMAAVEGVEGSQLRSQIARRLTSCPTKISRTLENCLKSYFQHLAKNVQKIDNTKPFSLIVEESYTALEVSLDKQMQLWKK